MGTVRKADKILFSGRFIDASYHPNWCNSMQEYYGSLHLYDIDENCKRITVATLSMGDMNSYEFSESGVTIDNTPNETITRERLIAVEAKRLELARIEEERHTLTKGKRIIIHKGRKYDHGIEALVFWVGKTAYGVSVGFEHNGQRLFISLSNVKIVHNGEHLTINDWK